MVKSRLHQAQSRYDAEYTAGRKTVVMGGYTRAVSGQRLGKNVAVVMQQIVINAKAGLQQWKSYFLCCPCRDIISKNKVS
jgi:hypothetical protein